MIDFLNKNNIFREALFADESPRYSDYQDIEGQGFLKTRFRTASQNVDSVFLILNNEEIRMNKVLEEKIFDYYEIEVSVDQECFYSYKIIKGQEIVYYNKKGYSDHPIAEGSFVVMPNFKTPDWAKGAVMYQIFVDRFRRSEHNAHVYDGEYIYLGRPVKYVEDWDDYPEEMDVHRFYGGDLKGVLEKLDYLQDLGVEAVYFNPLFVSPSNHKYDIQDYDYIDPHIGVIVEDGQREQDVVENNQRANCYIKRVTDKKNLKASNQLFVELVEQMHQRGIKVILDGVFNHCGSFNKWLDRERIYELQSDYQKGAYLSKESPYNDFFKFSKDNEWPYNQSYEGWWGHDTLPKLNYEGSKELEAYILDVAKRWVSPPYNVDGWRLDVAADLGHSKEYNHRFWQMFRRSVKTANPNAIIIAEHYGNPFDWLQGDQWDTVMNYDAFMEPITWFLTGLEKHSDEYVEDLIGNTLYFQETIIHHMAKYSWESLLVSMNQLSNHDHSRFLTRTNRMVGRIGTVGAKEAERNVDDRIMMQGIVFQMTWIGAPTLYYGDEAGVCGFTDPDSRRTYPWGKENQKLIGFYKALIKIHREHEVLKTGSVKFLGRETGVLAFGRFDDREQIVVIINQGELRKIDVPVWQIGVEENSHLKVLVQSDDYGYVLNKGYYKVNDKELNIEMSQHSAMILKVLPLN